jgi:hypothetical protein
MKAHFQKALNLNIKHDAAAAKFFIPLGDAELSLTYEVAGRSWTILSFQQPPQVARLGAGNRLVEYVLEFAKDQKVEVNANAVPFVHNYLLNNQRYQCLLPREVVE